MLHSASSSTHSSPQPIQRRPSLRLGAEDKIRDPQNEWTSHTEQVWALMHRAIAYDLNDTILALERMLDAPEVEPWEYAVMRTWWRRVVENIDQHHSHEEAILFPALRARIEIPLEVEAEHEALHALLEDATTTVDGLGEDTSPGDCIAALDALVALLLPHMRHEEAVILPAMMAAFSPREVTAIERRVTQRLTWLDAPHFYRALGHDLAKKHAHFSRFRGMPGFLFPAFAPKDFERYEREHGWMIKALREPAYKAWADEQRLAEHAQKQLGPMCVPLPGLATAMKKRRSRSSRASPVVSPEPQSAGPPQFVHAL